MKQIIATSTLLWIFVTSMAAQSTIYLHAQTPMTDAYIDSYITQEPSLPGLGQTFHTVVISVRTSDEETQTFGIYARIQIEGTNEFVSFNETLVRNTHPGAYSILRVRIAGKPIKIVSWYVERMHLAATDTLVFHPSK